MNEESFAFLLQQREDETLDFKQELPGSSDLAVLISAFYNTRGGKIVIGVDDERKPLGLARPQSVEACPAIAPGRPGLASSTSSVTDWIWMSCPPSRS
jgi:predicted HTH transcriptional regulator